MTTAVALSHPPAVVDSSGPVRLRSASAEDAPAIHALIGVYLDEGHLLPRQLGEIIVHADRFVVAAVGNQIAACADLAPLSRTVAEIRSLVVSNAARSAGLGRRLIDALIARAEAAGYAKLCAFTHAPGYFVQLGFSLVPHHWVPEKIQTDCRACAQFRRCGQFAVVLPLRQTHGACVPLASLHG